MITKRGEARELAGVVVAAIEKATRYQTKVQPATRLDGENMSRDVRLDMFDALQSDTGVYIHSYSGLNTPLAIYRCLRRTRQVTL